MFKRSSNPKNEGGFSIVVLPFSGRPAVHINISPLYIKLIAVLAAAILALMVGWFYSYWHVRKDAQENVHLRQKNESLMEEVDQMAFETWQLKQQMEDVEELSEDIKGLLAMEPYEVEDEDLFSLIENREGRQALGSGGRSETATEMEDLNTEALLELLMEKEDELKQLKEDAEEYGEMLRATPSIWPAEGRVSSEYGLRSSPFTGTEEFHEGIDIAAPAGTEIYAVADGTVKEKEYDRGYGRMLIIEHGYGFKTLFAHLSSYNVEEGQEVEKGEVIGFVGSTGFSTGPHLHYEVHMEGKPEDPRLFLPERGE